MSNRPDEVVAFVNASGHDGATVHELAAHLGLKLRAARPAWAEALRLGLIGRLKQEHQLDRFVSLEVHAAVLVERKERKRRLHREQMQRRQAAGIVNSAGYLLDPPEWKPTQRVVVAREVPPPKAAPARSVFDLVRAVSENDQ